MKICPRCGSRNVDWIIPQNWSVWECKDCDFTGPIIEGNKRMADEIKENYEVELKKERKKNNKKKSIEENEEENHEDDIEENLTDEEIERRLDQLEI